MQAAVESPKTNSGARESDAAVVAGEKIDSAGSPTLPASLESKEGGVDGDRAAGDGCAPEAHPLACLFPPMTDEEFQVFKNNVHAHPEMNKEVWLYQGKILDGRHAYRARIELGLLIEFRTWNGECGSPLDFVISRNLHRRHLTSSQRAAIAVSILPRLEEQAKERQTTQGNHGNEGGRGNGKPFPKDLGESSSKHDGEAVAQAAKIFGTNREYVNQAKQLQTEYPDLLQEVIQGEKTIPEAINQAKKVRRKKVRDADRRAEREEKRRASEEAKNRTIDPKDVSELLKDEPFDELVADLNEFLAKYRSLKKTPARCSFA